MNRINIPLICEKLLSFATLGWVLTLYQVTLRSVQARHQGMSVSEAIVYGLHSRWAILLPVLLLIGLLLLGLSKRIPRPKLDRKRDEVFWRRERDQALIFGIFLILFSAISLISNLTSGKWENKDFCVIALLIMGVHLTFVWRRIPSPEYLRALETGDTSQINDERMQRVDEKSAKSTINIFLAILMFVFLPYQVIVVAGWPVETIVVIGIFIVVRYASLAYWKRRL